MKSLEISSDMSLALQSDLSKNRDALKARGGEFGATLVAGILDEVEKTPFALQLAKVLVPYLEPLLRNRWGTTYGGDYPI
jgi:hypothetical protein